MTSYSCDVKFRISNSMKMSILSIITGIKKGFNHIITIKDTISTLNNYHKTIMNKYNNKINK